jgi:TPR repeat protein
LGVAIMPTLPAVMGADFEAGKRAGERSDYVTAMREFRPLADQGLAEAQLEVGFLYWFGRGVPKDKSEAEKWFTRAASAVPKWRQQAGRGDAQAALQLGMLLWVGKGIPGDPAAARLLIAQAAEAGVPEAQANLAGFLLEGGLFEKNQEEAARWCQRAAERGNAWAEYLLGRLYATGRGVKQDYSQAEIWLRRAVGHGSLDAYADLAAMYWDGKGLKQNVSEAFALYRVAAEKSFAPAMFATGMLLENGIGVQRDVGQAVQWYRRAAEQGYPQGQVLLGYLYYEGIGVHQSDSEAVKWFRNAADQGTPEAYYMLGLSYRSGRGVAQNHDEAVRWFQKAADAKYPDAWSELGTMYELGWGVPQDLPKAIGFLSSAASSGVAVAQLRLSRLYRSGNGVTRDHATANDWLKRAAQQGYVPAENELGFVMASGEGLPKDLAEATKWLRKAADSGYALGQFNLGFLYARLIEPRNPTAGEPWIRKAAEQGYLRAQYVLGLLYREGAGVPKDYVQAYMWLNLAAAAGEPEAGKTRDDLEKLMTAVRVGEAQDLTAKWKPQVAPVESAPESGAAHIAAPASPELASTGTGFVVTREGHVITNFHVVDGCTALLTERAGQRQAFSSVASDPKSDLALLKLASPGAPSATFRSGRGPGLGEPIMAAGFPLRGLLASTLNVTTGNISALAGIGDDATEYQITAPVQPGNSGGPLFDQSGNVVGVVVAKLDALKVAKWTGDVPQNVNFAIKSSIVQSFLDANSIQYSAAPSQMKLGPTETSQRASKFTIVVECWK